jgi:WD40 repeat protein
LVSGAFTSNGQLVTLDQDSRVRRWNLETQGEDKASRRELLKGGGVRALSPDGRMVAVADDKKVHVFDTITGKGQWQIDSPPERARRLLFTSDSGKLIIVDDQIRWCNAGTGEVMASAGQKYKRGSSLAVSADGLTLAVVGHGDLGGEVSVFRLAPATNRVSLVSKAIGTGGSTSASAVSPDGRLVAVGKMLSGQFTICDTDTGRVVSQHNSAHASPISAMTFSADGVKLVTADVEGVIKVWEDVRKLTSKSAALMTLKGHKGSITHVGFSSTGKQLVTTGADETARIWDLDRHPGAAIRPLERAGANCYVGRFSPDGQWIALADGPSVRLWDTATGRVVRELSVCDRGRVFSVAFSPTDHRLLAVGYGGAAGVSYVGLWDIDAGKEVARLPGAADLPDVHADDEYASAVGALAFSPNGKHLVAGFGSPSLFTPKIAPSTLKVWEVASRRLIRRLSGHTGYCLSLDFSRDGTRLASASRDGTAIIWSTETWKAMQILRNVESESVFGQVRKAMVEDVAFSPDAKTLAMASRAGSVLLWNVADGQLLATLKGHSSAVSALAYAPDGRTLATGGNDQTVRLWNVETRRELVQLNAGNIDLGGVESLAFSPDGKHLLAGGRAGAALWSTIPIIWNDPDRAAEILRQLWKSNADFRSRIRMFSENLRLHEALEKLDANDVQVQSALAATSANWHATHGRWAEASEEYDRLQKLAGGHAQAWLRTPGLLRVATALYHEGRSAQAADLLSGGAKRRAQDGLPPIVETIGLGFTYDRQPDGIRITGLIPGSSAVRSKLTVGDILVKADDVVLDATDPKVADLFKGDLGATIRLTVRHPRSGKMEEVEPEACGAHSWLQWRPASRKLPGTPRCSNCMPHLPANGPIRKRK